MTAEPYYADESVTLYLGDCRDVMAELPEASVHACVTDPPYDLTAGKTGGTGAASVNLDSPYGRSRIGTGNGSGGFMGKAWDSTGVAFEAETWRRVLRVLKPGGYLLAFGGSRTWHRMAVAIEDAGFELRDSIAWLYSQGFPKSMNVGEGRGTALKPAFEPIVMARKPLVGTVVANVEAHGTGALNIDAARVGMRDARELNSSGSIGYGGSEPQGIVTDGGVGRWPSNVALDATQAAHLDRQTGVMPARGNASPTKRASAIWNHAGPSDGPTDPGDSGGASRFFPTFRYEAKADTAERPTVNGVAHPTVKPIALMQWLVRLVTPPGGTVLEPFAGSGTTVEAAVREGFNCIAIEREADYLPLIVSRLNRPINHVMEFPA